MRAFLLGFLIGAFFLALTPFSSLPAQAQQQYVCGPHDAVRERLRELHGEVSVAVGITSNGNVLEVLASAAGTWTVVMTRPNGLSCLMAVGDGWQTFAQPQGQPMRWWPAAHGADWINRGGYTTPSGGSCCGERDCVALVPGSGPLVGDEFVIEHSGRVFRWPWKHSIPTADEKQRPFVCFDYDEEKRPKAVRCFFRDEWKG